MLREIFFTERAVRHRDRLPREAVIALSLAVFKVKLNGALDNNMKWLVSLPTL